MLPPRSAVLSHLIGISFGLLPATTFCPVHSCFHSSYSVPPVARLVAAITLFRIATLAAGANSIVSYRFDSEAGTLIQTGPSHTHATASAASASPSVVKPPAPLRQPQRPSSHCAWLPAGVIALHEGAGPRHLDFTRASRLRSRHLATHRRLRVAVVASVQSGKFAFVVNELDNTLSAFSYDPSTGTLTENGPTACTLPAGWASGAAECGAAPEMPFDFYSVPSHASEVLVHPNDKWVYVTNRGHDCKSADRMAAGPTGLLRAVTEGTRAAMQRSPASRSIWMALSDHRPLPPPAAGDTIFSPAAALPVEFEFESALSGSFATPLPAPF